MATTIIRPKTRAEWLDIRKSGIGSSEVATIVGLNPWETPLQLWRRKKGIDAPKEENFAMKSGHYLEDAVSRFWSDSSKREVIKRSAGDWLIRDNDRPFLQVSPDRTFWIDADGKRSEENKGILECKTTQMQIDPEDLPKHWFVQLQYLLGVAGYKHGSLAWLQAGREFDYRDFDFNAEFYAWLVESVEKFWRDSIEGDVEPSPISVKDVLLKYNRSTLAKTIEAEDAVFEAYTELKGVKAELAKLDERKEELEATIKAAFMDAEVMTYGGDIIATWKSAKDSQKLDTKGLQAAHPEICQEFIKTVAGTRRFLLK